MYERLKGKPKVFSGRLSDRKKTFLVTSETCGSFFGLHRGGNSHRNLRSRTSMLAQVWQIFWGKEHLVRNPLISTLHRQGNLLQRNNFSAVYKTSRQFTK
jgi:hypothetical protein